MSDPYKIKYNRNRHPECQKRADGTRGCCGCGGDIPKGRLTWCSRACYARFSPPMVIMAVKARDKEVCAMCGVDCRAARLERNYLSGTLPWSERQKLPPIPDAEYDHIIPFSEGGPTTLENMRTLCHFCHRQVTADWHKERAKNKKAVAEIQQPCLL